MDMDKVRISFANDFRTSLKFSFPEVEDRLVSRLTYHEILNAAGLEFIEVDPIPGRGEVLERLARGEITAEDAISELEGP